MPWFGCQGKGTPIYDHGAWGVVGVVEGVLSESNLIRVDCQGDDAATGIDLISGDETLLSSSPVTSFVPNPDHFHIARNPDPSQRVVSLHLYGHAMAGSNIYGMEERTLQWVETDYNEN